MQQRQDMLKIIAKKAPFFVALVDYMIAPNANHTGVYKNEAKHWQRGRSLVNNDQNESETKFRFDYEWNSDIQLVCWILSQRWSIV